MKQMITNTPDSKQLPLPLEQPNNTHLARVFNEAKKPIEIEWEMSTF